MQDSLPASHVEGLSRGKVGGLRVALVVASLRILGGQSVQAQRLLEGWEGDPAVHAWLVPIDPVPPAPFDRLLRVKYLRTVVTQLCYWPLLFRELRRADVVHAFSASYTSFLLAPLPAVIVARLLGKPVILNYHSGEAPDHLRRSRIARFVMRHLVDANVVPSAFLRDVLFSFDIDADVVSNTIDVRRFAYRSRTPLTARLLCTRNFEPMYNVPCVLRAFARIQARHPDATLTLVGSGSQDAALRAEAAALRLRTSRAITRRPTSTSRRRRSTTCRCRCSRRSRAGCRSSPPTWAACRPSSGIASTACSSPTTPTRRWRSRCSLCLVIRCWREGWRAPRIERSRPSNGRSCAKGGCVPTGEYRALVSKSPRRSSPRHQIPHDARPPEPPPADDRRRSPLARFRDGAHLRRPRPLASDDAPVAPRRHRPRARVRCHGRRDASCHRAAGLGGRRPPAGRSAGGAPLAMRDRSRPCSDCEACGVEQVARRRRRR